MKRIVLQIFIGVILCITHAVPQRFIRNQGQQNACITPLGDQGVCVSLKNCPQVVNLFTALPQNRAKQYSSALQRICGGQTTYDNYPVVCCSKVVADNNVYEAPGPRPDIVIVNQPPTVATTTRPAPVPESEGPVDSRVTSNQQPRPRTCRTPDASGGVCTPLKDCGELFNRLRNDPANEATKALLRESNRACSSVDTDVCCPSSTNAGPIVPTSRGGTTTNAPVPRRLPTEDEGCGFVQHNSKKIVGGEQAEIGAWPWMALLGYDVYSLAPFKCGGTLISARHVISAAHCLRSDLTFVRLGEYDLSTETETRHLDINIEKSIRHPDFSRDGRNDLSLLFLIQSVVFTDLISPICMPYSPTLRAKSYVRSTPFVAGWGRTEADGGDGANVLQQLQLPVLENSVCRDAFRANNKLMSEQQFDNSVICAGYLAGGRDTCQGDSGGPLMMPESYKGRTRYYLIGIVSYGIKCAQLGIPGVYTSVQFFMDWIEGKIAGG